jgi:hypothetical protein
MTALGVSSAIVRGWTRLYTWRLPALARDTRRAEIDSDLWEYSQDRGAEPGVASALASALHVIARLIAGIPDDVSWRVSHAPLRTGPMRAAISLTAAAMTVLAAWVYVVAAPMELPSPAPLVRVVDVYPPPPPPPPPPPRVIRRTSWTIVIHPAPRPSR